LGEELKRVQEKLGIPEQLLREIEASRLPNEESRIWHQQVEGAPPTAYLDDLAASGLEELRSLVDRAWLSDQAARTYRLGTEFLSTPLHILNGQRFISTKQVSPQRFAQMILVCRDHLAKRDDLDFFAAPLLVTEIAMLGNHLDDLRFLGKHAATKVSMLQSMIDDEVSATVYELLVGAACVRSGLDLEMLIPELNARTPDFRVHSLSVPAVIECKRRLGPSQYEVREANHIEMLYHSVVRPLTNERHLHVSIEIVFTDEVESVGPEPFAAALQSLLRASDMSGECEVNWGKLSYETLPYYDDVVRTRLYSPDFMEGVFGWSTCQRRWDGIICEVEPPNRIIVSKYREPRCLKWMSRSPTAVLKKSRGITSLWAKAIRQIPAGEMGFVYLAYPEGGGTEIADARSSHIIDTCKEWRHRWTITVPLTMVNRLYMRTFGPGSPDLIESTLVFVEGNSHHFLKDFPTCVFTVPPRRS
jgi:hypothetical protein